VQQTEAVRFEPGEQEQDPGVPQQVGREGDGGQREIRAEVGAVPGSSRVQRCERLDRSEDRHAYEQIANRGEGGLE